MAIKTFTGSKKTTRDRGRTALYTAYTVFFLFKLLYTAEIVGCMPIIYIIREGYNAIEMG